MLLAQNRFREAVDALQNAAKLNPLPEYQWTLAEALRAADRENEASGIEVQLRKQGGTSDPRTLALFLSTRHESPETALQLAQAELDSRSDVFTHDALAWSLAAAGKLSEAHSEMRRALAEGTADGRLFFHAAVIASKTGHAADADRWLRKAKELSHLLLPSERNQLPNAAASDAKQQASSAPNPKTTFPPGPKTARKTQPQPQTKT
jgi:Flp pilus assembly protein TadD